MCVYNVCGQFTVCNCAHIMSISGALCLFVCQILSVKFSEYHLTKTQRAVEEDW